LLKLEFQTIDLTGSSSNFPPVRLQARTFSLSSALMRKFHSISPPSFFSKHTAGRKKEEKKTVNEKKNLK
jgi:hypothetical protein